MNRLFTRRVYKKYLHVESKFKNPTGLMAVAALAIRNIEREPSAG